MATHWFKNDGSGVSVSLEEEGVLLVSLDPPDWILIPEESPVSPGEKKRVIGTTQRICPKCRQREVRVLIMEDNFRCAECFPKPGCGFVLYKVQG